MGFVRDLVKAGSVGFVETALEHVGSLMRVQSTRHLLRPPSGPLLTSKGLCHVGQNWFCWFGRYQERVSSDAHSWKVASVFFFFAILAFLASEVGNTGKTMNPKKTCSRFFDLSFSYDSSIAKMSRTTVRSREVLILLSLLVVTTPHHRCSVADMAWDRSVSVGRMLAI